MLRDFIMILFVTCATLGSQLLIKGAVVRIASLDPVPSGTQWLLAAITAPRIWMAVAVQGVGFLVWVVVVSRVKLGPAFATSGALFYILLALASWVLYDERLTPWQWAGIAMVSAGVLMISMLGRPA